MPGADAHRDEAAAGLSGLLDRPMATVDGGARDAIAAGPIDPARALAPDAVGRLLEPGDLPAETGWCRLRDGTGYAAVRTPMPGVTAEMIDWWFDWHPRDPLRYRIWFPGAHQGISVDPAPRPEAKPYWGTVHHPVEDVGLGMQHLRIRFLDPAAFGFPPGALDDPAVATIVCGIVGDDRRRVWHTRMCHFARRAGDGVELRSRFWLGAVIGPFGPAALSNAAARVLNAPVLRRRLVPGRAPRAMAEHCAAEYANLAALLPELFREYAGPARD